MKVAVLDPSLLTHDAATASQDGDVIISKAVHHSLASLVPGVSIVATLSTHAPLGDQQIASLRQADLVLVGGSNLLGNSTSRWRGLARGRQWPLTLDSASAINQRGLLFGVGWRTYEIPTAETGAILRRALSPGLLHAVRDQFTARQLGCLGFENVVVTGCPTLWPFRESPPCVPTARGDAVLTAVTSYRRDIRRDLALFRFLGRHYTRVFAWPQDRRDPVYLRVLRLAGARFSTLPPGLESLSQFAATHRDRCDYVGNRLHGGIFCLSRGMRSIVVAIDSRATELGATTGVPVVQPGDWDGLKRWFQSDGRLELKVDWAGVDRFLGQFRGPGDT